MQGTLDVRAIALLVELALEGTDTQVGEEVLHHQRHAAVTLAEHHHRIQPLHLAHSLSTCNAPRCSCFSRTYVVLEGFVLVLTSSLLQPAQVVLHVLIVSFTTTDFIVSFRKQLLGAPVQMPSAATAGRMRSAGAGWTRHSRVDGMKVHLLQHRWMSGRAGWGSQGSGRPGSGRGRVGERRAAPTHERAPCYARRGRIERPSCAQHFYVHYLPG